MNFSSKELRADLKQNGYIYINNFLKKDVIKSCKEDILQLVDSEKKINALTTSPNSMHIHNFFLYSQILRKVLFGSKIQEIHKTFFGHSYCLRNAVASNCQIHSDEDNEFIKPIGTNWHRDTPNFIDKDGNSKALGAGFSYQIMIALDKTDNNNSTKILNKSHLYTDILSHNLTNKNEDRMIKNYGITNIRLDAGDIAIIDDNLFHKVGKSNSRSRWILFCSYTPWFIKPYFNFSEIILDNITKYEKHCLHKTSMIPEPQCKISNTFKPEEW